MSDFEFDVAIIGGGCAGLTTALALDPRLRVAVFCKRPLGNGASAWAQGGIAAVCDEQDSFESHINDTMRAGAGLCDPKAVREIVHDAPQAIEWLHQMGVKFNRAADASQITKRAAPAGGAAVGGGDAGSGGGGNGGDGGDAGSDCGGDDGDGGGAGSDGDGGSAGSDCGDQARFARARGAWELGLEGGHGHRRIVHADDKTGWAVVSVLRGRARRRRNVRIYENHIAVNLCAPDGVCVGVYMLDIGARAVRAVSARAVVLACGGAGRVYLYSSTPADSSGDGIAMAYRAGCAIVNMEFFQFHPTCLYHPAQPTLLISEAVRGEGARLVNGGGRAFVRHEAGDLAPRDIVARAIDKEIKRAGSDSVFLDCRAHPREYWHKRFPSIAGECLRRGIDIPRDKIPVVPAAHYTCGGARADLRGRTDVRGLYAVGETAHIGLHGANRLASNSLLECVVMGRRCAADINARSGFGGGEGSDAGSDGGSFDTTWDGEAQELRVAKPPKPPLEWDERRIMPAGEGVMIAHNWDELRRAMSDYVGILRSDERLARARRRVEWIRDEIEEHYRRYVVDRDFLELRNLTQCAQLIIEGALARRESRGLHYNVDCPQAAAVAEATVLRRDDFLARGRAVNARCPFSRRLVVAGATMAYRGVEVGFCNRGCRDSFARAVAAGFVGAADDIMRAKKTLDSYL